MAKLCILCGSDVSSAKRIKDEKGRYYCAPCYEQGIARRRAPQHADAADGAAAPAAGASGPAVAEPPAAAQVDEYDLKPAGAASGLPVIVNVGPAAHTAPVAAPPAAGSADDSGGAYDLKEEPKPKQVPQAACAARKRVLPETRVRLIDGEFRCTDCISKAAAPAAKTSRRAAKVEPDADAAPTPIADFLGTVPGIIVTAAVTLLGSWVALSAGLQLSGVAHSPLSALVGGVGMVIFSVVLAVLLIFSMFLTDRMFGGLGFGTVSSVIWKSMTLVVLNNLLYLASVRNETLGALSYGLMPLLWLIGFVLVFRIDFFEALVLSLVNSMINKIAMLFAFTALMGFFVGGSSHERDDELHVPGGGVPGHVAPAVPNHDPAPDAGQ